MTFNFLKKKSELVSISFELKMPGLYRTKNSLTNVMPDTEFIVERSNFCCERYSRGIIRVNDKDFSKVKENMRKIDNFELELFSESKKIFQYRFIGSPMAKIISKIPFFVVFPVRFKGKGFVPYEILILEKYVNKFFNELEKNKIEFRNFSKGRRESSTCKILTDRQRAIFAMAHNEGLYDFPRRTSVSALAEKFGLSSSNLSKHLMKIESRIMGSFADENLSKYS